MNPPILITGFHRSGTSAVAGALGAAGLDLGSKLLDADSDNPHGHFEDERIVSLHDELLARGGLTWKSTTPLAETAPCRELIERYVNERSTRAAGKRWGAKDPRLCLFLAEWLEVSSEASVIFVLRPPGAAIASLHRRHIRRHVDTRGIDPSDLDFWRIPDLGLKLWIHYHRSALPSLQTCDARIVTYGDPASVDETLASLAQDFDLPGQPARLDASLGRPETTAVVDTDLIDAARTIWNEILG